MLDEMHIANVALIRNSFFRPAPSMTVITGETGSGKTALLNALKLLVGERAQAGMVREGAEELCVEGRFFLENSEGEAAEDGLVVCRTVGANGRSRVTINGSLAGVKDLAAGAGTSIDLCGQHEHQQLLNATYQRKLFDRWGAADISSALERYKEAFALCAQTQAEVDRLVEMSQASSVALDRARFTAEQIETVSPKPGEYEELLKEMPFYENGELLIKEAASAYTTLSGEGGVIEELESVAASLARIHEIDASFEAHKQGLQEALINIEDLSHELARYQSSIDFSETELEVRQTRVSALQGIMRGYGPTMAEVFANYEEATSLIASYNSCDELLAQARAAREEAEAKLVACAADLAKARGKVAPKFEKAVTAQMARLEMGSAALSIALANLPREQWNRSGSQALDYLFIPGAGLSPQKLSAIASGGEISRVMLAIKVVLGSCDSVDTLVFDEIDAGVGGKTALALAAVLKDLANSHQVIVVTHLPQVAVMGDAHYLVEKVEKPQLTTEIRSLAPEERTEEIARMLAGKVDATSLAHAKELLEAAQ